MAASAALRETTFREPLVLDAGTGSMEEMEIARPKKPLKFVREFVWEAISVKEDEELYIRPYLRRFGQILEGFFLLCILSCLMISIVDSFNNLEVTHPESHCWRDCCKRRGKCSKEICKAHENDTSIDDVCQFALSWGVFRDWTLEVLLIIFTTEYTLRVWSCVEDIRFRGPLLGRLKWMRQPMSLIDLFSLIPFYIDILVSEHDTHGSSYVFRTIRLLRIITVFRWKRPLKAMHILVEVAGKKSEELMVTFFGSMILILLIGSFMYVLEGDANPEMFPNIPNALWWCISCLSTVGYGDVVPITWMGKMLGSLASVLGVGLFAMPAGILGSGFLEVYAERKARHSRSKWDQRAVEQTNGQTDGNHNDAKDFGTQNDSSLHASEITEIDNYPTLANFTNLERRMTSMEGEMRDLRAMISSLHDLLRPIAASRSTDAQVE